MHAGLIPGPPYARMCTRMGPTLCLFIILAGICNGFRWQEWLGLAPAPGPRLFRRGTHETTQVGNPAVVVPVQADPVVADPGAEDQPPQQPAVLVAARLHAIPEPLAAENAKTGQAVGPSDAVQVVAESTPVEVEEAEPRPAVLSLSTASLVPPSTLESPEKPKEEGSEKASDTSASLTAKAFYRRKVYTTSHPVKRPHAGRGTELPQKPTGLPGIRERVWSPMNLHGNGVQSDPLPKTTTAATFGLARAESQVDLPTEPANESILDGRTSEEPLQHASGAEPPAANRKLRAALCTNANNPPDESHFQDALCSWNPYGGRSCTWWGLYRESCCATPSESVAGVSQDDEGKFSDAEDSASAAHQSGPSGDLLAKRHTQVTKLTDSQVVTVTECSSSLSMLSSSRAAQMRMRSSLAWEDKEGPPTPRTPRRRVANSGAQSLASSAIVPRESEQSEQSEDEVHAAESLLHNSAAEASASVELKL